ncbi:hypothetical protein C9E81_07035 [Paracoccus alkanivorans]|uniref:Hedgehog/Intein (Hint) domain-containing protein n=2 Tax=Paracoccus alkanivorans TaxID=2116655 RepID=A0A3M0ML64_9RHOB|nr:hypothetical protein C9E81_07035 [Paracoccus alkanivorans]
MQIRFVGGGDSATFDIWDDDTRDDGDDLDEYVARGGGSRHQEIAEAVTLNGETWQPRGDTGYGPQLQADWVLTSSDFSKIGDGATEGDNTITAGHALIGVSFEERVNVNGLSNHTDGIIFAGDTQPTPGEIYSFTPSGRQSAYPIDYSSLVTCFTTGTLIETCNGPVPIEKLGVGDMVRSCDHGLQPVRWIGATRVDRSALARNPKLLPVRIKAGALTQGLPRHDLLVSRQHRMLVRSEIARRMFGTKEVLVPAIQLVGWDGIDIATDVDSVTYWHVMFDAHEVIFAHGTPSESLFAGPMALASLSPDALEEITTLFPEVAAPDFAGVPARQFASRGAAVRQLVARHARQGKPLL